MAVAGPNGGSFKVDFPHGVASGDPTPDTVVLWTRAVPSAPAKQVPLRLQVSLTSSFEELIGERTVVATEDSDYTVRVLVHELPADQWFFYRFLAEDGTVSRVGRSRTAPALDAERSVRIAYASCQAYEGGYFTAYRDLIRQDEAAAAEQQIDCILHLGDFIYEALGYGRVRKVPAFPSGGGLNDAGQPFANSLEDYRHLYKVYLADPDLQAARARWPFIVTWDDHEFSDDCWQSVATYTRAGEPSQPRKYAANRAWFEFIPALLSGVPPTGAAGQHAHDFAAAERPIHAAPLEALDEHGFADEANNRAAIGSLCIYRSFRWGRQVELLVTDTRSYRTAHAVPAEINQLVSGQDRYITPLELVRMMDAGRTFADGNPPKAIPLGEKVVPNPRWDQPPGTILGDQQKRWLKASLSGSGAKWKVLASSVPMMPLRLDLEQVNPDARTAVFTTDTWEGYLLERQEILSWVEAEGITNFVTLAGDHHSNYAGYLAPDFASQPLKACGVEFAVCGISSPSVFAAVASVSKPEDPMRPLVTFDSRPFGGATPLQENLNVTFLFGTKAAMASAKGAPKETVESLRNPLHNRHLAYADTNAYGIAVVEFGEQQAGVRFHVIPAPVEPPAEVPSQPLRTVHFSVPTWDSSTGPQLSGPVFEGKAPYPFG
jgi:alkaline phosphatase D